MDKPTLQALFGQPPKRAIAYLEQKELMPSEDWWRVQGNAHNKSFVIAHMTYMDLLSDIRNSLVDAQKNGLNLKEWSATAEDKMRAKGWWGKKEIQTEAGTREVQLGSAYRLKTIYQTNMAQAYEAGRQAVIWDDNPLFPYVMYSAILDNKTRPRHRALHGVVMRKSDPAWQFIAPKNGYNCRCTIIELMDGEVAGQKIKVYDSGSYLQVYDVDVSNGGIAKIAKLDFPDRPSFSTDAGWVGRPNQLVFPDLDKYPAKQSQQFVNQLLNNTKTFEDTYTHLENTVAKELQRLEAEGVNWKRSEEKAKIRERLTPLVVTGTKFPIAVINEKFAAQIGASTTTVLLSDDTLLKQIINRQGQDIGVDEYALVQPTLEMPTIVTDDRPYHYTFFRRNNKVYVAVIKVTRDGKEIYLQSFRYGDEKKLQKIIDDGKFMEIKD